MSLDQLGVGGDQLHAEHPAVGREDGLCHYNGSFALQLNAARLQRSLGWLVGALARTAALTKRDLAPGTCEAFHGEFGNYKRCGDSELSMLRRLPLALLLNGHPSGNVWKSRRLNDGSSQAVWTSSWSACIPACSQLLSLTIASKLRDWRNDKQRNSVGLEHQAIHKPLA